MAKTYKKSSTQGIAPMTIHIDVTRAHNPNAERKGTFKEPWPLVKLVTNTDVEWQVKNGKLRDTFVVSFPNGSPFPGVTAINQATGALTASNEGNYHYQVFLTDGDTGELYSIHNCPEIEINPGP